MAEYRAPVADIQFALETTGGLNDWDKIPAFEDASKDLVEQVLIEAGKLTTDLVGPTNRIGDQEGAKLVDGKVKTPDAFVPVHQAYVEGGWGSLGFDPEYGGQGLPATLAFAVQEMMASANMAYSLNPMLTAGAIEAIAAHGSNEIRDFYLPKLISGEWSATMNLTEPHAGTDVGAVRSKAEPVGDGSYKISGQKIFITWGDHELSDNIIHLVLARTPGAPAGTKGISMFLVPKYLPDENGKPGKRNDAYCVSLEHKLGIHASPTCVMAFGDSDDCVGWLVGDENAGMRNMFTMMNHARVNVGIQGVSIAERAYQDAAGYAMDRIQSAKAGSPDRTPVAIINHADVRRTLMTMRAYTEASRAILYRNAWAIDRSHNATDADEKAKASLEADLLTPISKAFATDLGVEVASMGVQIHGGMGFVEETGVAQHYRDARIAPIYEGTNGIQALDLIGRKLNQAGGASWRTLIQEMKDAVPALTDQLTDAQASLSSAIATLETVAEKLFANGMKKFDDTAAGATPFLRLFGGVLGGYLLAVQATEAAERLAAQDGDANFMNAKIATAQFYLDQLMPVAVASEKAALASADQVRALSDEDFLRAV